MNILIVTQYFWPENFRINDLALGLREAGHEVTVLTGIPNYPAGRFFPGYGWFRKMREDFSGANVIRVPHISRGNGGGLRLTLNYLSFVLFASLFGPVLCRGRFDLIFVYEPSPITVGLPAIVLKKLKRAPIMFWVLDLWPESLAATGAVTSPRVLNGVRRLVRFIYRRCDRVLVQSRAFVDPVARVGAARDKILYFPNWAESLFQSGTIEMEAIGADMFPQGFLVMFAGNVGVAQDFPTILAAAELLRAEKTIHWLIVGDGRMLAWVREEVERRALTQTVHLLGQHPLALMPQFFDKADVMLVTLKREAIFSLTIPGKLQSYLAYGKPVVAALDGAGAQVVEEAHAGRTCAAEDPQALAQAVLAMRQASKTQLNAMGENGKAYYAKNFERAMLLNRLQQWMQELTAEKQASA